MTLFGFESRLSLSLKDEVLLSFAMALAFSISAALRLEDVAVKIEGCYYSLV